MKFNIGVLINTYNRPDDARINMDLIRNLWQNSDLFSEIKIVHSFNGQKEWYPKKYLEDELVEIENTTHFRGASELIDEGIKILNQKYLNLDFIIVLAADTWLVKPGYISNILNNMKDNKQHLASCSWGAPERNEIFEVGMAVDFFIIDSKWTMQNKMFPFDYKNFSDKYAEFLLYYRGGQVMLEKLAWMRFIQAVFHELGTNVGLKQNALSRFYEFKDREPVHYEIDENGNWQRDAYWKKIGLLTHHEPEPKKEILRELGITEGENIKKLLESSNLDYYNKTPL